MIWFLNMRHTFPDLKASPLTPERFENKHPHRDAFCQRAMNLLNTAGYDGLRWWMYWATPTQCQVVPSHFKQVVMAWGPGRGCWDPPGATTGHWHPVPLPGGHALPLPWSGRGKMIHRLRTVPSQKELLLVSSYEKSKGILNTVFILSG